MPTVKRPDVLAAVYRAMSGLIVRGAVPSTIIQHNHTIFRSVPGQHLPKPPAGRSLSRHLANQALMPRDGAAGGENRFSGPSHDPAIPSASGLYCVLQQQALVNEVMHYSQKSGNTAFADKCVLKIRLMSSVNCVDLSPHNPGHQQFLNHLLNAQDVRQALAKNALPAVQINLWNQITDGSDCSVARGIGLAVANSSAYHGLIAETVRESDRSAAERGDNLILFGASMTRISLLWVEQAWFFDNGAVGPEVFPVDFP